MNSNILLFSNTFLVKYSIISQISKFFVSKVNFADHRVGIFFKAIYILENVQYFKLFKSHILLKIIDSR